jgi:hypothetical protein
MILFFFKVTKERLELKASFNSLQFIHMAPAEKGKPPSSFEYIDRGGWTLYSSVPVEDREATNNTL